MAFQLPGIHLKNKVIVFESDDWGSKRMPNSDVFETCLQNGYKVDQNIYTQYDCLESSEDLTALSEVLSSFKTKPVFTLNMLMANPNFSEIQKNGYNNYYFEKISEDSDYAIQLNKIKKGIESGVFSAQFHGREHINVHRWLNALKGGDKDVLFAFNQGMAGIFPKENVSNGNDMVVALENYNKTDLEEKVQITEEGLEIFEEIFEKKSDSAIACNYVWNDQIEQVYKKCDVKLIQSSRFQLLPKGEYLGFNKKLAYTGKRNSLGQVYSVRNVQFEPTINQNKDWVTSALNEIELSFKLKKPAIMSTHRINFCGNLSIKNRDQSLAKLTLLLKEIEKKWPEVEFCSSDQLFKKYLNKK